MSVPMPEQLRCEWRYPKSWFDTLRTGIGRLWPDSTYDHDECRHCGCCAYEKDHGSSEDPSWTYLSSDVMVGES